MVDTEQSQATDDSDLMPDDDHTNADWAKVTWDLFDENYKLIKTLPALRAYLDDIHMTPEQFMTLPIYQQNVERMPWLSTLADTNKTARKQEQMSGSYKAGNAGNPEALINWFNNGADGQIDWGSPGDWQQCVDVASDHMTEDQAQGFCELRHQDATGMSTAEHAHEEKSK